MKITSINKETGRISIEGFSNESFLVNNVLKIDSKDYITLQELILEVYYG